jgi:hypothetical protein
MREPGGGPGGKPPGGTYCGFERMGAGGRSGTSEGGRCCCGLPKIASKMFGNCAAAGEAASMPRSGNNAKMRA